MEGLLEKDIRLLLRSRQTVVLVLALALLIGFAQDGTFIIGYFPLMIAIFLTRTISYDEMENGYQFMLTLPIDVKMYVKEKYIFCMGGTLLAWLAAVALYFVSKAVHGDAISFWKDLPMTFPFLPIVLLTLALMIPIQIKFGVERSRLVMLGCVGALVAIIFMLTNVIEADTVKEIAAQLDRINESVLKVGGVILTLVLVIVSCRISYGIMRKKEF